MEHNEAPQITEGRSAGKESREKAFDISLMDTDVWNTG